MDFILEQSSPSSLRPSVKKPSFNSRQSGDYVSQVRSIPTCNPIKPPLLPTRQERVSSTENPFVKGKRFSSLSNSNRDLEEIIERLTEDFNKKYHSLEEKLMWEVDRVACVKEQEIEGLKEQLRLKQEVLKAFEGLMD